MSLYIIVLNYAEGKLRTDGWRENPITCLVFGGQQFSTEKGILLIKSVLKEKYFVTGCSKWFLYFFQISPI